MTDDEIDERISSILRRSIIALFVASIILVISLAADIFCNQQEKYYWLQRSGSLVAILSATAEYWLSQIYADIHPAPSSYVAEDKWNIKYGSKYNALSYLGLAFLILGTIVWGYGDIPFKNS